MEKGLGALLIQSRVEASESIFVKRKMKKKLWAKSFWKKTGVSLLERLNLPREDFKENHNLGEYKRKFCNISKNYPKVPEEGLHSKNF